MTSAARADSPSSPYAVLVKPKATWTYEVLRPRSHKPTGTRLTVTVTSVRAAGAYTVIETSTTATPPGGSDYELPPLIVGPDGVHAVMNLEAQGPNGGNDYSEANIRALYQDQYLPTIYLPAALAKGKAKLDLDRFGQDDRVYALTVTTSQPDKHTWRVAWKGTYTVPEDESGAKTRLGASNDFDPAVGLTRICLEDDTCLRLVP